MTSQVKQALLVVRTLLLILLLVTNLSNGFLIRQRSVLTDIEPAEHKPDDAQRQTFIELLQTLQKINSEIEKQRELNNGLPDLQHSEMERHQSPSVDKRDYGIMPPWNEMCRLMRIAYCNKKR